jgi:ketosteroid isomerase-like protein
MLRVPSLRSGAVLLLTLTTFCQPKERPAAADSAGQQSAPAAPSARQSAEQAERAIRAVETRWRDVVARKDTAAIKTFYSKDAVYLPQDRPPGKGRDAIAKMWTTGEFSLEGLRLERTPSRIDVAQSGDIANEVGSWVLRAKRKGLPMEGRGNYVTAWRNEGGEWKVSAYIWNTGH